VTAVCANVTNNYDLFAVFIDNISAELLNRDSVLISEWSADEVVTRRPSTNFVCSTMTNLRVVVRLLPLRHPSSIQLFRVWLLCADDGQCRNAVVWPEYRTELQWSSARLLGQIRLFSAR